MGRGLGGDVTVVGHGQDGNLRDAAVAALHAARPLVDRRQVRVHVPRVAAAAGDFFARGGDFAEGVAIGCQVCQDDEDVLFQLVGVVFGRRQREAGGDDAFDAAEANQPC